MESFGERLARLEQAHRELDDIVLGQWDFKAGKRTPGLAEKIDSMAAQISLLLKIIKWGIGPLVTICAIAATGTSAKEFLPAVVKIAFSLINSH